MGRPRGSRNRDYEQTRHALATQMGPHLLREGGEPATLSDLSAAAQVSPTTLKHYFTDRDGVFDAVMQAALVDSRAYLDAASDPGDPGDQSAEQALTGLLLGTVHAWRRYGLGRLFACSLALGLESSRRGPAFLDGLLEPFLQTAERALAVHVERDQLPHVDVRATALSLVSPVVLALLHQDNLGGAGTRRLDVEQFAVAHARLVLGGLSRTSERDGHHDDPDVAPVTSG